MKWTMGRQWAHGVSGLVTRPESRIAGWKALAGTLAIWGALLRPAAAQELAPADATDAPAGQANPDDLDKLLDLADKDVSQLSNVKVAAPALQEEVSTVSRQKSTVGKSPAAVFVITNEMIRRSGATTVPEALRMAPGVNVARIDGNKWAVSIRGFNSRFANKLLVQIDGRVVYTPLFGGVFWDVQDLMLADVERIEVIRGPGASVWGSNAVNGIINIITKRAKDTQGTYLEARTGTEERGVVMGRYGGQLGQDAHYRVYGKGFERDGQYTGNADAQDDWRQGRTGFRTDWDASPCDLFTVQGDYYRGTSDGRTVSPDPFTISRVFDDSVLVSGGNALVRWTHLIDEDTDWSLQAYFDRTERCYKTQGFREDRNTADVDFQYRFSPACDHAFVVGCGYRNTADKTRNSPFAIEFDPAERATDIFSYFVQDQMTLRDDLLYFIAGCKFEHNDYTQFEYQPTARLLFTPDERHSIWASVSRAVRIPTRAEDNVRITTAFQQPAFFPRILGNPAVTSEHLMAYELGMRAQPVERFSWDVAVFLHDYNDLVGSTATGITPVFPGPPGPPFYYDQTLGNFDKAQSYGFEAAVNYQMHERWKLFGSYSFLRTDYDGASQLQGDGPRNQLWLQSTWDLGCHWELDLIWRYVDSHQYGAIPAYNTMDVRLGWYPTQHFGLALVGRNLFDPRHVEAGPDLMTGNVTTEVQREFYGSVMVRY